MKTFFDLDGTVLDISARWYALHSDMATKHGLPVLPRELYVMRKRDGISENKILEESGSAIDIEKLNAYNAERIAHIEDDIYLELDVPMPDIFGVLTYWGKWTPLVLVTLRKRADAAREQLKRLGLTPFFENILITKGGSKKEAIVAAYISADYEGALFVGDGEEDYLSAQALSMRSCIVSYGTRSKSFLESKGIIKLIRAPKELMEIPYSTND